VGDPTPSCTDAASYLVRRVGDCEEYLLLSNASSRSTSFAANVCAIVETFENLENSFEILVA